MNVRSTIDIRHAERIFWLVAVVAVLACVAGAVLFREAFFHAYLFGFLLWLGVAVGALGLLLLHHLVGGKWGVAVRPILESFTRTLPLSVVSAVPMLIGINFLYPWTEHGFFDEPLMRHRAQWLFPSFFVARTILYCVIWSALAWVMTRWGRDHDQTDPDSAKSKRLRLASGWGLVVYCLVGTFASIDWVLSLDPRWFSTIYGMLFIVGQVLAALAVMTLFAAHEAQHPSPGNSPAVKALHDLGNLLLTFVLLWVYLAFMQFLIIWMANMREEVPWYVQRSAGVWPWLALALFLFHFVVPFFLLLIRANKRSPTRLAIIAALVLVMRMVDYVWQLGPRVAPHTWSAAWVWIVVPIALGALWLACFASNLRRLEAEEVRRV